MTFHSFVFINIMETTPQNDVTTSNHEERSLLVVILDLSPVPWGERDLARAANDKARLSHNKRSVGPAVLDDLLRATEAFGSAYHCLQRDSILVIIGVAGNEVAVLHPRKDQLQAIFQVKEGGMVSMTTSSGNNNNSGGQSRHENVILGAAELVQRASAKTSLAAQKGDGDVVGDVYQTQASMAAALSMALCMVNRFNVASGTGVSALQTASSWHRADDQGVLAMMGDTTTTGGGGTSHTSHKKHRAWSPRILMIQASEDRSRDYNAVMNGAFCAVKHQIVIDGCFLPLGSKTTGSSPFLEQVCDRTGGVFLAPSGAAQASGALTEVLLSVFLAEPRSCRPMLHLPAIHKVDFRARCFESGGMVDMAYVCNQCLSIFQHIPKNECPTCGALPRGQTSHAS